MEKIEKTCSVCGKKFMDTHNGHGKRCNHCRHEAEKQKKKAAMTQATNPLYGALRHDEDGKPICNICGEAYHNLGIHIVRQHNMTISEYRKKFKLKPTTKLTSFSYQRERIKQMLNHPDALNSVKTANKDTEWFFKTRCKYCRHYSPSRRWCNLNNKLIKHIPECEAK